jgi:hypothetical protein
MLRRRIRRKVSFLILLSHFLPLHMVHSLLFEFIGHRFSL